jgi:alcohol dehydrogenase class IV
VPTTAGTGSEVTYAFVVSLTGEDGKPRKLGVGHPDMTPDVALVDPAMTRDLPRNVTADSGMDAVTQAIEGYVATWANEFSDGLCLTAIRQLFEFLPRAWEKGAGDMESREKVANAATMAGLGYINSMVGAAHSMAHAAGAALGLTHGRACGLFLPYVIEYSASRKRPEDVKTRYAEIMAHLGQGQMDEHEAGVRLAAAVRGLARGMNQPLTLLEAGVSREDFDAALPDMIENALADTVIFTAPRQPNESDLHNMFVAAYG